MIDRIIINYYKCIGQSDIKFNRFKDIIISNNGVGHYPPAWKNYPKARASTH